MLATYGVDVLDPAVSLRRVWVLAEQLPPHARNGGLDWSTESELLAGLIDHVAYLTWVTMRVNGSKAARPKPVKRPADRRAVTAARARPRLEPSAADGTGGEVKAASWGEAARLIAGMDGMRVHDG